MDVSDWFKSHATLQIWLWTNQKQSIIDIKHNLNSIIHVVIIQDDDNIQVSDSILWFQVYCAGRASM